MASRQRCTSATRGQQQPKRILGPEEAEEVNETQDVAAVGALSMVAGAAGGPALEQLGDAGIELGARGAELRGLVAGENRRHSSGSFRTTRLRSSAAQSRQCRSPVPRPQILP